MPPIAASAPGGYAARAARWMAELLDEPSRVPGALHPRSYDAVGTGVEYRADARGVGARQADESGSACRATGNGEWLDVRDSKRAVLEVDPDEVDGLGDHLRQRDVAHGDDRAEEPRTRFKPYADASTPLPLRVNRCILRALHRVIGSPVDRQIEGVRSVLDRARDSFVRCRNRCRASGASAGVLAAGFPPRTR
jgi:hypothetical protein